MANGMDKDTTKRIIFAGAALCGVVAIIGLSVFYRADNAPYLSFAGLEKSDQVKVRVQAQGQSLALTADEGNSFVAPRDVKGNYLLNISIDRNGNYRDIIFGVNQADNKLSLFASGFAPGDTLNIRRGEETVLTGLHFDWAGRIEIDHDYSAENAGSLCLETGSGFSTCHLLPKGDRA